MRKKSHSIEPRTALQLLREKTDVLEAAEKVVRDAEQDCWQALQEAVQYAFDASGGKLKQKAIAEKANISPQYLGDIHKRTRTLNVPLLRKLDISLTQLTPTPATKK